MVIIAITAIFIFWSKGSAFLLPLQFIPSFITFVAAASGLLGIGFLLILVLTAVFGRVYCAALCPLGILQDGIRGLARKFRRKSYYGYQKPLPKLQLAIFVLILVSSLLGSLSLLNLFEPYSLFGRIATNLLAPILLGLRNLVIPVLEHFGVYRFSTISLHHISLSVLFLNLSLFVALIIMVVFRGRLYCNTVCPVGYALGFFAKYSLFKIRIDPENCTLCGKCALDCPSGCIDSANMQIDANRCIMCFDCLESCPASSIRYGFVHEVPAVQEPDRRKRRFLAQSFLGLAAVTAAGMALRSKVRGALLPEKSKPVMPPGAGNLDHFTARCTACHLCVRHCPTTVIRPAVGEYGLSGMMQATLDFSLGYCDYDCTICSDICPTGALQPLPLGEKRLTQLGIVKLVPKRCVVYRFQQDCGACAEVCPTHAVYTRERRGVFYPWTNAELCIGCGHCELVCPAQPEKAITVSGTCIQTKALPPFSQETPAKQSKESEALQEFPF